MNNGSEAVLRRPLRYYERARGLSGVALLGAKGKQSPPLLEKGMRRNHVSGGFETTNTRRKKSLGGETIIWSMEKKKEP